MEDSQLAEISIRCLEQAATMRVWAIPPELNPLFLDRHGYYPFFCAVKEIINQYEAEKADSKEEE